MTGRTESLPREVVQEFRISSGDQLLVDFVRIPRLETLIGCLKERMSAEEFSKLSNEGEDLGGRSGRQLRGELFVGG